MEVYICKFDFGLPLLKLPNLENNAILHIFSNVLFSVFVSNAPRYQQCAGLLSSPRTSMVSWTCTCQSPYPCSKCSQLIQFYMSFFTLSVYQFFLFNWPCSLWGTMFGAIEIAISRHCIGCINSVEYDDLCYTNFFKLFFLGGRHSRCMVSWQQ